MPRFHISVLGALASLPALAFAQDIRPFFAGSPITSVALTPDAGVIAASTDKVGQQAGVVFRVSADGRIYTRAPLPLDFVGGISADGTRIAGTTGNADPRTSVNALAADRAVVLGGPWQPMTIPSAALAISADGHTVVGASAAGGDPYFTATRWVDGGPPQTLGSLPGQSGSVARGVSANGTVIVGRAGNQAFRWTEADGMQALPTPPGKSAAEAVAVSADGNVVLLKVTGTLYPEAWTWTVADGLQRGATELDPTAITGDGAAIVGQSNRNAGRWPSGYAFPALGLYLANLGVDLRGFNSVLYGVSSALAITPDGTHVAGNGTSLAKPILWVARIQGRLALPPPLVEFRRRAQSYDGLTKTFAGTALNVTRFTVYKDGRAFRVRVTPGKSWTVRVPARPGINRVRAIARTPAGTSRDTLTVRLVPSRGPR